MTPPNDDKPTRPPRDRRSRDRGRRQAPHVPPGYLVVGQITGSHGIRGEVKVDLYTDFPDERFAQDEEIYVGDQLTQMQVRSARPHKGRLLIQFQDVADRSQADTLRGLWLFIPEEAAVQLEEDAYYVHQIIGLSVQTVDGTPLGEIKDVLFTGANEVYIVEPEDDGQNLLIPAIAEVVQTVDLEASLMTVELLPGMVGNDD